MNKPGNMTASPERVALVREFLAADPARSSLGHREVAAQLGVPESAVRRCRATLAQGTKMKLPLDRITVDPTLQLRHDVDRLQTDAYADRYRDNGYLPPVVVFRDGEVYRLADGHQRHAGATLAGLAEIDAEVREGDYLAALAHAAGANADHGVNRTDADKAKAVGAILARPEYAARSNREVAKVCNVSHVFVASCRDRAGARPDVVEVTRNGKTYEMKPAAKPAPPDDAAPVMMTHSDPEPASASPAHPVTLPDSPPETPAVSDFTPRAESDGEWLAGFRLRNDLSARCRAIFDADAVAWRRITGHERFKEFADLVAKHTPATGHYGFTWWIRRTLRTKGPDHWLLCTDCHGQGHRETATDCKSCKGAGYKTAG